MDVGLQGGATSAPVLQTVGWHCVIDLHDCESPHLDDEDWVRRTMLAAASRAEATILGERFHRFSPQGISGVVIIGESHLAIHVWPERKFAAIDVFTCNTSLKTRAAAEYLTAEFGARHSKTAWLARGHRETRSGEAPPDAERHNGIDASGIRSIRLQSANDLYIDHEGEEGGHWFVCRQVIVSQRTKIQKVDIVELSRFGRALVLDNDVQSVEADEYVYHEALVQPAMCLHPSPKRVLIIGGGEGAVAREVLKDSRVERLVMVDIDAEFVALAREHLSTWHRGAFDDPRLEVVIADGSEFVRGASELFDIVIIDVVSSFEAGPAEGLYTAEFYAAAKQRLSEGGVIVVQAMECQLGGLQHHARVRDLLESQFAIVRSYQIFVPSFWSMWGFVLASDRIDPVGATSDSIDATIAQRDLAALLRFYDGRTHAGIFALPKDVRGQLGET